MAEERGHTGLAGAALKAWCGALKGIATMIGRRKQLMSGRRLGPGEYRSLLKRYRISAEELTLRD